MYKVAFKSILVSILVLAVNAAPVLASKGTPGVANTPHNLSATAPDFFLGSDEEEVCIFCHTPHGGSLTGPLWNRGDSAQAYTHYTSSTLSTLVSSTRVGNISPESSLCLSCHDGSISMYTVMNASNTLGAQPTPFMDATMRSGFVGAQGPNIGQGTDATGAPTAVNNDLSDDHPISFLYKSVLDDPTNANDLQTIAYAEGQGVRFFPIGAADALKRVECSSCHDPHVDYLANSNWAPFLITPNAGSALCLACHNK